MIKKLVQSLQESVKKRNTPEAFVVNTSDDANIIHRGYIKNSTWPIKYDFMPASKQQFKNDGLHLYRFMNSGSMGVVQINHKLNKNIKTGHETISMISAELGDFENNVELQRTVLPAILHHLGSHDPDIIELKKGFKYTKDLVSRIDPEGKKFEISKEKEGTIIKKKSPLGEKAKRIIDNIQSSINKRRRR